MKIISQRGNFNIKVNSYNKRGYNYNYNLDYRLYKGTYYYNNNSQFYNTYYNR